MATKTQLWYIERDTAAEAQIALERELWLLESTGRLAMADINRPELLGDDSGRWCASAVVTVVVPEASGRAA